MGRDLEGRHALVTGGGRGIGWACAKALAAAGAKVTLLGRTEAQLKERAGALPAAQAIVCDVTDEASVAAAFQEAKAGFGPVALLVANAGQAESAPFAKTGTETLRRMLDVNLIGVFHCAQAALPDMLSAGWGRIVAVASTAGLTGYAYVSAYCAAKHAAVGLVRSLALETARSGVTVNAVCPGFTATDLTEQALDAIQAQTGRSREQALAELVRENPQDRLVEPEEVANTVVWLCGTGASAITGQTVAVAGGAVMR